MSILMRRLNDALRTNRSSANKQLTNGASNWLWAVFALFTFTLISWLIWNFVLKAPGHTKASKHDTTATTTTGTHGSHGAGPQPERIFHYLWIVAAFAGMVAYFAMASNLGNTPIRQYLHHGNNPFQTRQVFYARYIYWFIAWPMVVIATLILSGVSWATILFAVAMQELWVISWLCGALVQTKYKWGFYAFGILAYLVLAAVLLVWGRKHSVRLSSKHYTPLAAALVTVWALYIIAWGLSEGGNYLSISGEHIFYGILDLISVPLVGFAFLALSRKWDHGNLGLRYTQGRVTHHDGYGHAGYSEKGLAGPHNNHGAVAGTHDGVPGHHNGVTGTHDGVTGHHNGVAGHNGVLGHDNTTTTHGHGVTGTHPNGTTHTTMA